MVNVYEEFIDKDGNNIPDRTKLFIPASEVKEDGTFIVFQHGVLVTPITSGYFYIVDKWLIEQIEKTKLIDGQLQIKDGEELIPPVKSERDFQREALLKQLAELESVIILEEEEELS